MHQADWSGPRMSENDSTTRARLESRLTLSTRPDDEDRTGVIWCDDQPIACVFEQPHGTIVTTSEAHGGIVGLVLEALGGRLAGDWLQQPAGAPVRWGADAVRQSVAAVIRAAVLTARGAR